MLKIIECGNFLTCLAKCSCMENMDNHI